MIRCRLSEEGKRACDNHERQGVLVGFTADGAAKIKWDGYKTIRYCSPAHIEQIPDDEIEN